jgi:hypothetical protein
MTLMEGTASRPGLLDAVETLQRLPAAFCVAEKVNVLHAVLLRVQQAITRDTSRAVSEDSARAWGGA